MAAFMTRLRQIKADLVTQSSDLLEQNIRLNVYHGIIANIALNMVNPFVGIFAVRLGATNYQIGLVSSAPALVGLLAMIPGGKFVDTRVDKKRWCAIFMLLHRLFYLLLAAIPFFTPDKRAGVLVLTLALMNLPGSIANVSWQGFISRVVPQKRRASAFAKRSLAMNVSGTIAVLIAGRLLDIITYPVGYQLVFAAAFVFAFTEIWVFRHLQELPDAAEGAVTTEIPVKVFLAGLPRAIISDLKEIVTKSRFMRFALTSIFFYFAWQVAWPLFTLYQVRELGATNQWVSILNLSNTGGSLVGYGFWSKYMERNGSLKTLFVSTLGMFVVPVVYAFSRSFYTIAFFNILTGAIFSGVMLSLFNSLLDMTPDERKTTYIAYYNTAVTASAIFAPMAGVALLGLLGYRWAFLATGALRLAGSLAFGLVYYLERRESRNATDLSQTG
ncbi:MAG TPA: MFS transporter [Bacillota bacterium]|nr:MFS transporter [Bacillota bacterium]